MAVDEEEAELPRRGCPNRSLGTRTISITRWERRVPKLELSTVLGRAARLRCPRCGEGKLFIGWFRMHERCSHCGLKYERAPGYFLGSTYINYGLTTMILMFAYIGLHFGLELSHRAVTAPLMAFVVIFPLFFFRYARAFWLALDCFFDPESREHDTD